MAYYNGQRIISSLNYGSNNYNNLVNKPIKNLEINGTIYQIILNIITNQGDGWYLVDDGNETKYLICNSYSFNGSICVYGQEGEGTYYNNNGVIEKSSDGAFAIGERDDLTTTEKNTLVAAINELNRNKVDKVSGKGLSTNDYTTAEKTKLSGISTGAEVNTISRIKLNGETQIVEDKGVNLDITPYLNDKVDKVSGKGLSTNDYTTAEKTKLTGIAESAQVNVIESVKVNGTALPISSKSVNIPIVNLSEYVEVNTLATFKAALTANKKLISFKTGANITIGEQITIPANTTIYGNGGTITRQSGYSGKILNVNTGCRIQDLNINGNRTTVSSPTWETTIEIATYGNCTLDNIVITNGNECIICYGNNNVVTNCEITNCGGNGIHFSGGDHTLVNNCRVIGSNKKSGMGHEDGCIIWSNECDYIVCTNNYCEDGKCGFGSIDDIQNSNVKLTGNTVKNCTYAVEGSFQLANPYNIVISQNTFINSGQIYFNKTNNNIACLGKFILSNNILEKTSIYLKGISNIVIESNDISYGFIKLVVCPNATISSNNIFCNENYTLYIEQCHNIVIRGNNVLGIGVVLFMGETNNPVFDGNNIKQYYIDNTATYGLNIQSSTYGVVFNNNKLSFYGNCMQLANYWNVINNTFYCLEAATYAIKGWGGTTYLLVQGNRTSGHLSISTSGAGCVVENNTEGIPEYSWQTVTQNLTNITSVGATKAILGSRYFLTLSGANGKSLPSTITVTNNGITSTVGNEYSYNSTTGEIIINCVMGAITITASGV